MLASQCAVPVAMKMYQIISAYTLTVHKSQGSTYQYVFADFTKHIIPFTRFSLSHDQQGNMSDWYELGNGTASQDASYLPRFAVFIRYDSYSH